MPKVWKDTIDEHRQAVREATMDATAALVAERGLRSVTMSRIAADTGIGRATLYKYFGDVESILHAWHERQVGGHLRQLAEARDREGAPLSRLLAVLETYALISSRSRRHHDTELAALMHRSSHVTRAEGKLRRMIRGLVSDAQESGDLRTDVSAEELTSYCLHALTAATTLASKAATERLVEVTMAGMRRRRPA